ncbi:MAG: hypothetical protein U9N59_13715 [Campylobacterota bacterium]|nr:hypothetical protein [Campylobacterota bacterium]
MKQLLKIFLLLTFFQVFSFSCTLCTVQTPSIHVLVKKDIIDDKTLFKIKWTFNTPFTKQTIDSYPEKFDIKFKLQEIKKSLEKYIIKNDYLTYITYDIDKKYVVKNVSSSKLQLKHNMFIYSYSFTANLNKKQNENLDIKFEDKGNFFIFNFNQDNIIDRSKSPQNIIIQYLSKTLKDITNNIKELLNDLDKSNSAISYIWLLSFSFLYGILHAIGPGHGKSLISSYFLKDDSSHIKALSMSGLIGVVHTFSAFILTLVIYYSVDTFLGSYFNNVEKIATKISAVIIIAIALYLIYKKIIKSRNNHQNSCGCSGCKTHSTDIGVILSAGIVPCAGTVTIFIYTMSLNMYFIGFLSAVFMSLGMSLIIYITALLSIKIRDKASTNTTVIKFFEYGSLAFILFLGVILLIV